jgi:hypothetical protein
MPTSDQPRAAFGAEKGRWDVTFFSWDRATRRVTFNPLTMLLYVAALAVVTGCAVRLWEWAL